MPETETPAETLRRASARVRELLAALRDDMATADYWACDHPEATEDEIYRSGTEDAMGGAAGEYAAAWTPAVAEAVAASLDATAEEMGVQPGTVFADDDGRVHGLVGMQGVHLGERREWTGACRLACAVLGEPATAGGGAR